MRILYLCRTNRQPKHKQVGYARVLARNYLKRLETAMPEDSPLVRQWIMLRTLCARHYGATVKEMVQEMGVSEKTIRRDLDTFQQAGFPLEETVGDYGRKTWRIDPTKSQPGMAFEFDLGHTEEIKRWVLSFGRHAVIEEPNALREDVREELAAIRCDYDDVNRESERPRAGT